MPEGPELHIAAQFVTKVCKNRVFSGAVLKSVVSTKNPDIPWNESTYNIYAASRGKEIQLYLSSQASKKCKAAEPKLMTILVRFGMSGKFQFTHKDDMDKHAHLNFFTAEEDMVLSFVDYRRFGRWEITSNWGPKRGPCILTEYQAFRENVLGNLERAVFKKPICEAMLDQAFFNGVGNYLRAEVLYRLKIPPFERARNILEDVTSVEDNVKVEQPMKSEVKQEEGSDNDFLLTCHQVATEVIKLNENGGSYESLRYMEEAADESTKSQDLFMCWLQCYYQPGMKNMVDNHGRTIWYDGPAGPLAPKSKMTRGKVKRKALINKSAAEDRSVKEEPKVKKAKSAGKKSASKSKVQSPKNQKNVCNDKEGFSVHGSSGKSTVRENQEVVNGGCRRSSRNASKK